MSVSDKENITSVDWHALVVESSMMEGSVVVYIEENSVEEGSIMEEKD